MHRLKLIIMLAIAIYMFLIWTITLVVPTHHSILYFALWGVVTSFGIAFALVLALEQHDKDE